jgi:hypothetical protein
MRVPGLVALSVALAAADGAAQDSLELTLVLDGRLVTAPNATSFLDGGLGKTRYGSRPRAVRAEAGQVAGLAAWRATPALDLRVQVNLDAERDLGRRVDLVEAFARFRPGLTEALGLDVKAGLFFPSISVENTDPGWLSPYTTSFSAINSWIAEESRTVGVEGGPVIRVGETRVRPWGSFSKRNDPSGTLLSWRGFAIHDRVSRLGDRLPLAPLRSFDRPDLFPEQARWVEPLREVDGRWTWSAGADVAGPSYRVRAMFQPGTADEARFDGEQYAWRTGFLSLGASVAFGPVELLAQALDGTTRMGRTPRGPAVDSGFRAAFGLASLSFHAHRVSIRYDAFEVDDRDAFLNEDANDESGSAWTFAYVVPLHERARVFLEVLRVDSTRTNRSDLRERPRQVETLGTLALRVRF